MAQEPRAPWSRWDLPGLQYMAPSTSARPYYGPWTASSAPGQQPRQQYDGVGGSLPLIGSATPVVNNVPSITGAKLVSKDANPTDPSFYNCVYSIPNSIQEIIQQCHVDLGCCETTCCENNWKTKYGWALALLLLFCLAVLFSLLVWLVVWLINRARDKQQRRKLLGNANQPSGRLTPASSHHNISPYATAGYPPGSPVFYDRNNDIGGRWGTLGSKY